MQDNNNKEVKTEDFEIVATKRTEINKEQLFKLLAKHEELILTIDRVGKVIKSKYPDKKGVYPYGCFIDYVVDVEEPEENVTEYEIGIYYNLGVPTMEQKFNLTSGFYIFKILETVVDLSNAEEIAVTEDFISNTLKGVSFIATLGTSKHGFYIKPVELLGIE